MKQKKIYKFIILLFLSFPIYGSVFASEINGSILNNPSFAFGENLGWINFGCQNCNVLVTDNGLSGFAWSKEYGWINLSPTNAGVTNNCEGELGGRAWSNSLGWIDFSGVTINSAGVFGGIAGTPGTQTGRINFSCDNCGVETDWRQCDLRESPAQVLINTVTVNQPNVVANVTITNEGFVPTEYQYEWCVVNDINNSCGGGDDVYNATAAKLINPGENWITNLSAIVSNPGNYYFKLVVYFGDESSGSSRPFTIPGAPTGGGGGSGGGGGGGSSQSEKAGECNGADFNFDKKVNSVDFSILLSFWKKKDPFANKCVDVNSDKQVNSVDFSILLSQWGTSGIKIK